jgi:hypothetical protein
MKSVTGLYAHPACIVNIQLPGGKLSNLKRKSRFLYENMSNVKQCFYTWFDCVYTRAYACTSVPVKPYHQISAK